MEGGEDILQGRVVFGDCIDDEWMVVWVLQELTRRYPGVIARVVDDDGQFLLIEAANALPDWITPDVAINRVFIVNGSLHIVPLSTQVMSISDGISAVRQHPRETIAMPAIQIAIAHRLRSFPHEPIRACQHYARARLHADAIALLDANPALIAPIIESFYHRDPIDLRICKRMSIFNPQSSSSPSPSWYSARFTRCTFAQLEAQKFTAPTCFDEDWTSTTPGSDLEVAAVQRGIKLMCGLEVLFATQSSMLKKASKAGQSPKEFGCFVDGRGRSLPEMLEDVRACARPDQRPLEFDQLREDDADVWMTIGEEQFNQMASSYVPADPNALPEQIVESMRSFMSSVSGVEGADPRPNLDDDRPISLDFSAFMDALQRDFEDAGVDADDEFYAGADTSGDDDDEGEMRSYMKGMDQELNLPPVDVDVNLIRNLLDSFKAQAGAAGPTSNLMHSLGVSLPDDIDNETGAST